MQSARPESTTSAQLTLLPLARSASSLADFGVEIHGCDLSALTDSDFQLLERAVYTHQVVVVRGQRHVSPAQQYALTRRFDPSVESYGHGNDATSLRKSVLSRDLVSIPDVPQVKLLGHGRVAAHEGLEDVLLEHPSHRAFHHTTVSAQDEARGVTRFYRWHIDAALYALHPPKVTTLLALQVPAQRPQTVAYDDDVGELLGVPLGTTAFVSGYQAFERLSARDQDFALRTRVRYAPHPYVWMRDARARSDGLGLVSEGRELSRALLPPFDEASIAVYPMVWLNPLTGRRALQVHACCAEDLLTDGRPLGDLAECREILHRLMRPAIAPERVYAHDWQPGDLVLFDNRGVWHSVVGTLREDDLRVFHQCNLASRDPPRGA